jgi:hypothetical protein
MAMQAYSVFAEILMGNLSFRSQRIVCKLVNNVQNGGKPVGQTFLSAGVGVAVATPESPAFSEGWQYNCHPSRDPILEG